MGTQYLIDTNASIEFLSGLLPQQGSQWLQNVIDSRIHYMSVVNYIELFSYKGTPAEMQTLRDFINTTTILPLLDDVVEQTINIRRINKIKLPDAVVAATALIFQLTLVTRNVGDFKRIQGLNLINLHDI